MTKDEFVEFIVDSINEDNLELCKMGNMPEEQIKQSMADSQPALQLMASNLYDRMKEKNLLV
jgi:malonyl CoA-acyl carrier protein transacylase